MARGQKYKYNPESLDYEKVESSFREKLLKSLLVIAPAVLLAIATQQTSNTIALLAIIHVCARVVYNIFYLMKFIVQLV